MTITLGLTGSIGMGKSTTAQLFAALGCAVWDADAAVARLYAPGGAALAPLRALVPDAVTEDGVDRAVLRSALRADPALFAALEKIVHPLVRDDRAAFLANTAARIAVLDIPLLFETGGDREMMATACVTVAPEVQRERVLARQTMTAEDLDGILAKQMPNDEKCRRADYVIPSDTMEDARRAVRSIVDDLKTRFPDA
jgi:dephospho-CoA kinase